VDARLLTGQIITVVGALFLFLGALGVVRMPDIYNRMQAGTKATTLGNLLTLGGLGIMRPEWLPKILLIAMFVLLTNPISSHALARAAHRVGLPLTGGSVRDDLAEHEGDSTGPGSGVTEGSDREGGART
jgi:multicomponent Na+:H+ antiporter subunit G